MRANNIQRLGTAFSVLIYSLSSVAVAVGERDRRVGLSERNLNGGFVVSEPRGLGVGLENLKYGSRGKKHYTEKSKGRSKGKGKGEYYSNDFEENWRENFTKGKGSGKGNDDSIHEYSESLSRSEPDFSTKSIKPKNQKKEHVNSKREKQSKLKKSEKSSPTHKQISRPTRLPANNQPSPSPSVTSTGKSSSPPSPNNGDKNRSLSPYKIVYTMTSDERPPFRSELLEVVELTRVYLDREFFSFYENSELTNLLKFMTLFTNTAFDFGEAVPINYESKAMFESSSILLPDREDLDSILLSAFEGDNLDGYIGLLQSLPPSNMFSSTQFVELVQTKEDSTAYKREDTPGETMARNITLSAIVVGGVAGLILIFASTRIFRRQSKHDSDKSIFGHKSSSTIAGETFTTRGSRKDDRMFRPICDELYNDRVENRR